MDFTMWMPVRVLSGRGVVRQHSAQLRELGTSALLVTGKHSAHASGAYRDFAEAMEREGIRYIVYDNMTANPLASSCIEAAGLARKEKVQFVVGIGGGSPLDAAKAVAVLAANEGLTLQELLRKEWKQPPLPLVLAGTTAGTGSEVSATSVLTWEDGRKRSIVHPDLYAKLAFADPAYTESMGPDVRISTALDAFSHAAEGFLSPRCTDVPDWCARKALPLLWSGLQELKKGDISSQRKEGIFYASLWAGIVLGAVGTAFPHPFGYVLTEDFGIPHGRACAAFLPELLDIAQREEPERVLDFLQLLGAQKEQVKELLWELSDVGQVHMTAEQAAGYAARWDNLHNYANVPGGYSKEQGAQLVCRYFVTKA